MPGKSQAEYEELLRAVIDACRRAGYEPDTAVVMTDFESAIIMRATTDVLEAAVQRKGCFYHLYPEHLAQGLLLCC